MQGNVIITDGSVDFSGGVDSNKVTTVQSDRNPNGLGRNQLAWLDNATVRDGGIYPRWGYKRLQVVASGGLFQGKWLYDPLDGFPYHIYSISGHIWLVIEGQAPQDLSALFGLFNPPDEPIAHFVQANKYLIIQCGDFGKRGPVIPGTTDADGNTLPLFWDGVTLRRSKGITNPAIPPGTPGVNE